MSVPVVWVAPDLSAMRLYGASGEAVWRAPALKTTGDEETPGTGAWRQRVAEAASWLAQQRGVKRRLGALVIDPSESVCLWVRSSSLAAPVLSAQVARLIEEWGGEAGMWSVEPVYDAPRDSSMGAEHALSAVCHHDALTRLLLDAIDKRGVVPGAVLSGWHALAHHAKNEAGVTCVIEHNAETKRLAWAWSDAEGLLAGGGAGIGDLEGEHAEAVASAVMQRTAMDWMTWSSQLGTTPERAVVIGPGAKAIGEAWKRAFPDRPVRIGTPEEGPGATLAMLSQRLDEEGTEAIAVSTRLCLGRLTHRPTRKTRSRYQIAGAAALIAAIAIGSIAVWMRGRVEDWSSGAEEARAEATEILNTTWPGELQGRPTNLVSEARRMYEEDLREAKDIKLPNAPYPIYEEALRVSRLLVDVAEQTKADAPEDLLENWQIKIQKLSMDDASVRLSLFTPERRVTTEIGVRLNDQGYAKWSPVRNTAPERPTFQGNWQVKE